MTAFGDGPTNEESEDAAPKRQPKPRRGRGEGGLRWSESRKRWIAEVTIGYRPDGKRIVRSASGKTKTGARDELRAKLREVEDGVADAPAKYTVPQAVEYWLDHGLTGRGETTVEMYRIFASNHILPWFKKQRLRTLKAKDVRQWLDAKSSILSTRSLKIIHNILDRSVRLAMADDYVQRNVVALCDVPEGRAGRASKSLTLAQAEAVLDAGSRAGVRMYAYTTVSLLSGGRTEEVRALHWEHVVTRDPETGRWLPVAEGGWNGDEFAIHVWRSVRKKGDTKTKRSRRSLLLPKRAADALRALWEDPVYGCWTFVFATRNGTKMSAHNVRRDFRKVLAKAGLNADEWTPRETRHSFVSLLSDNDVAIEEISRLVGHTSTVVTETVYRFQLRPVLQTGAQAMDRIFPDETEEA